MLFEELVAKWGFNLEIENKNTQGYYQKYSNGLFRITHYIVEGHCDISYLLHHNGQFVFDVGVIKTGDYTEWDTYLSSN